MLSYKTYLPTNTYIGTPIQVIINTEDRKLFKDRLNEIGEKLAPSCEAYNTEEALTAAKHIQYPVMVKPEPEPGFYIPVPD